MISKHSLIFLISTMLTSGLVFAIGGDVSKGQTKADSCAACHGTDGNSLVPDFPKLAGQNERYLFKQLKDFKSGVRSDPAMMGIVAKLTEEDMSHLSAYYAAQTSTKNTTKQTTNIALGRKIYRGGKKDTGVTACIACHGPRGTGIPSAGFPALSSQHIAYTIKQLKDFRQHSINTQTSDNKPSRTNDYEGVMINFTKSLTNAEIEAVAQYIATLH